MRTNQPIGLALNFRHFLAEIYAEIPSQAKVVGIEADRFLGYCCFTCTLVLSC